MRGRRWLCGKRGFIKGALRVGVGKPRIEAVSRQVSRDGGVAAARQQRDQALKKPGAPPCAVNEYKWGTLLGRRAVRT